jgi:hypothetical protein
MFDIKPDVAPILPIRIYEAGNGIESSDPLVGVGSKNHNIFISGKKLIHKHWQLLRVPVGVTSLESFQLPEYLAANSLRGVTKVHLVRGNQGALLQNDVSLCDPASSKA